MARRIVVINDTQEILELFREILEQEGGYEVITLTYEPDILPVIKPLKPDLIISDHMFGEDKIGWQLIQKLHMDREMETIPIIVCSGAVRELRDLEGHLKQKDIDVLYKPFNIDELLRLVERKMAQLDKQSAGR